MKTRKEGFLWAFSVSLPEGNIFRNPSRLETRRTITILTQAIDRNRKAIENRIRYFQKEEDVEREMVGAGGLMLFFFDQTFSMFFLRNKNT